MADAPSFSKFVPGFDFLQGLVKNAGAALPNMGQWIAPTLDPKELEKRIEELKTVQFWLEQNARMLGATIQALEVQRMTLSTLQTMNVQMEDLRDSMKIRMPDLAAAEPAKAPPAPEPRPAVGGTAAADAGKEAPGAAAGAVDPMQWWGALTRQFTELATSAMKDGGAMRNLTDALQPGLAATASQPAPKKAAAARPGAARKAGKRSSAGASARPAAKKAP
jgi:hypothetical protein